jgi:hypothetical protein
MKGGRDLLMSDILKVIRNKGEVDPNREKDTTLISPEMPRMAPSKSFIYI